MDAATDLVSVGFILVRHGKPVKTGRIGAQTAKLYATAGSARRTASNRSGVGIFECFVQVPSEQPDTP